MYFLNTNKVRKMLRSCEMAVLIISYIIITSSDYK